LRQFPGFSLPRRYPDCYPSGGNMAEHIKFTDRTIATLPIPPHGQRVEYADTETDGLRLRVTSSGVKTFSLLRRIRNGPMERVTLGRFPDAYKAESARTKARKLNGVIADGANPAEVKRANKGEPTFAELFAEYIERHAKPNKRTWNEDEAKYSQYLERRLGKKKISKITRSDVAAIHGAITSAGHPIAANRVKALLSSVFGKAVKWGYLDINPAKGTESNAEKSRDRFLRPGELPRVFAALDDEPSVTFRDYFLMALLTGARRDNVRTMRWTELDLERGEWAIPMTKNGQPQRVPLVPEAIAILKERFEAAAAGARYVFPSSRADSKYGHIGGEHKAWRRVLDRVEMTELRARIEKAGGKVDGDDHEHRTYTLQRLRDVAKRMKIDTDGARLDDIHIHDLRRTMGSWQARTGASMIIIGKSLGHKSHQSTAVYARLDLDPVRAAMETATSAMLEAARQKPGADVLPYKKRA
jgi:integrase